MPGRKGELRGWCCCGQASAGRRTIDATRQVADAGQQRQQPAGHGSQATNLAEADGLQAEQPLGRVGLIVEVDGHHPMIVTAAGQLDGPGDLVSLVLGGAAGRRHQHHRHPRPLLGLGKPRSPRIARRNVEVVEENRGPAGQQMGAELVGRGPLGAREGDEHLPPARLPVRSHGKTVVPSAGTYPVVAGTRPWAH